jgi:hypothetical protein
MGLLTTIFPRRTKSTVIIFQLDINQYEFLDLKINDEPAARSFLERDNFEHELGSTAEDPFAEDFHDIARHEIVGCPLFKLIIQV